MESLRIYASLSNRNKLSVPLSPLAGREPERGVSLLVGSPL
jgi:hypothetical protein